MGESKESWRDCITVGFQSLTTNQNQISVKLNSQLVLTLPDFKIGHLLIMRQEVVASADKKLSDAFKLPAEHCRSSVQ